LFFFPSCLPCTTATQQQQHCINIFLFLSFSLSSFCQRGRRGEGKEEKKRELEEGERKEKGKEWKKEDKRRNKREKHEENKRREEGNKFAGWGHTLFEKGASLSSPS